MLLKRGIVLFVFTVIAVFVYSQSRRLPLSFYVLFPMLVFPLYFISDYFKRWLFWPLLIVSGGLLAMAAYRYQTSEALFLGAIAGTVLVLLSFYRKQWQRMSVREEEEEGRCRTELDSLRKKYETRLESLHRLENQVTSLMELFEIARDFSECLSFENMAKLIREKVLPELNFHELKLLILDREKTEFGILKAFLVRAEETVEIQDDFKSEEKKLFVEALESKQLVKGDREESAAGTGAGEKWVFPMVLDGKTAALLMVRGAAPEDMVRFEVLVAHLTLQVKKILLYETVKSLAIVDGLTGVYVRRHFIERFNEEVQRSIKFGLPLAVLMLDIDHFKRYNDEFGHLVGDATLKEVAALLRQNLRKVDVVARYGGEEFIAVLPETNGEAAREVAERIRSNIARHRFRVYDVETRVTVSLGISLFPENIPEEKTRSFHPDIGFDLIRHADRALYRAKEEGRNRIYRYQDL